MDFLDKKKFHKANFCPICNGKSTIIDTVQTIDPNSDEILNLRRCFNCRHWWIDPMPNQKYLSYLYKKASEFVGVRDYKGTVEPTKIDLQTIERYASQLFDSFPKKDKYNYLEIGVGSGDGFNFFKKKANLYYGVEPGTWKPKNSNIVEDIADIPKDIKFDIIVIQDVLEHLENPIDMLTRLRNLVNDGGIISCGFPNSDSLKAKIFRGKWRMVMPIGHLHYFSSESIIKMFEKAGWSVTKKYSCRPAMLSVLDVLKQFNWYWHNPIKFVYRSIKSLFLAQLLLGKDQWYVQGKAL